jgi:hypothetical protein
VLTAFTGSTYSIACRSTLRKVTLAASLVESETKCRSAWFENGGRQDRETSQANPRATNRVATQHPHSYQNLGSMQLMKTWTAVAGQAMHCLEQLDIPGNRHARGPVISLLAFTTIRYAQGFWKAEGPEMNLSLMENATPPVVGQGSTPPDHRRSLAHPVTLAKGPIIGCASGGATYRNKVAYLETSCRRHWMR